MDLTDAVWRKSSRSANNSGACVEVAAVWRKASRSASNGGACVEVAVDRRVAVRDSKDPAGPKLAFTSKEWDTFVGRVKDGTFDR